MQGAAPFSRREFIQIAAAAGAALPLGGPRQFPLSGRGGKRPICIYSKHLEFLDSERGGNALMYNALMYEVTKRALEITRGQSFETPVDLLDGIFEEVHEQAKRITGNPDLRERFILNSLVGVDQAAWLLYAAEHGITDFDEMIPEAYRSGLSHRHDRVARIPMMALSLPLDKVKAAADDGHFFMKIKIGQPGTQAKMLEEEMEVANDMSLFCL